MRIERCEDIEAWQLARELTRKVYGLTKKAKFTRGFGLKKKIQDAAGSSKGFIGSAAYAEATSCQEVRG